MREDEIIVRGKHGSEEVGFQPFLETQKMINVHHMYNKGTTPLSHGAGPTVCGLTP